MRLFPRDFVAQNKPRLPGWPSRCLAHTTLLLTYDSLPTYHFCLWLVHTSHWDCTTPLQSNHTGARGLFPGHPCRPRPPDRTAPSAQYGRNPNPLFSRASRVSGTSQRARLRGYRESKYLLLCCAFPSIPNIPRQYCPPHQSLACGYS